MFWENGAWPNIFTLLLKLYSYFLRQYNENFVLLQKKKQKKKTTFFIEQRKHGFELINMSESLLNDLCICPPLLRLSRERLSPVINPQSCHIYLGAVTL